MVLGIFGAGGLGREILETARLVNAWTKRYRKLVFIVDCPQCREVGGLKVLSLHAAAEQYPGELELALAVGEPATRREIIGRVRSMGLDFVSLIHPDVTIPDSTEIGEGSYIAPHCFVSCNVKIGKYALIQPNVNIGHDCVLGDNVSVCGMTTLGGHCTLGDDVFLAMGVSVIQNCTIGCHSVIGLGSAVFHNVSPHVVVLGNPAKPVARNTSGHRVFR